MTDIYSHDSYTIERVYPNCVAHVWSAWSIPEKKAKWFGGGTDDMDFRIGGSERKSFRNEMGEHTNETRYFEIRDEALIVLGYSMAMNGRVHTVSLTTIAFMDENGGTRLRYTEQMCVLPPSDGAKGRSHGWGVLLDNLGSYLDEDTIANAGAMRA
ncbi:SRPBCC domain-containing protein [Rhizobium sp. TH2]|uniref:SRPBCC domain-containing protein n=1 Tax=Rhizobium sp. TH2 TaxID=2775403 RepID=UPI0021577422|nr:SRPBCC domain-containing protein [Rhizobium sp. TH2]UVC11482.1 SRPBCC domain-containing protein [Rhizobium sp. TH2]